MFLTLDNNKELTEKYVEKVIYYLHPSYKENKIEIDQHPYLLSRTSFGRFVIGCEIFFHDWSKLAPVRIDHTITLKDSGKVYTCLMNI